MIQADIITIGDELLIGQVLDTNSAWIAAQLNMLGITVRQITSIPDTKEAIVSTVQESLNRVSIALITGGLGPTKDDITKYALAEMFACKGWFIDEKTLQHITEMLTGRGIAVGELNKKQAEVPDCCKPIFNSKGTAPGMWFEQNERVVISMPGVPYEMKAVFSNALPLLQKAFLLDKLYHRTMLTYGIPESTLAETIEGWEDALPAHMKLAYLPSPELGVRLRLSAYGEDYEVIEEEVAREFRKLEPILGGCIYGFDEESLESVVGKLLKSKKQTLAAAESCTGGTVASRITAIAGCSEYFKGAIVAYSNDIKEAFLGVKSSDLMQYGAVSKEVVEQMALGAVKALKTDYAIASSGIAGPAGGTSSKPVGTVWIAIATPNGVISQKYLFNHDRALIVSRASAVALNMLRLAILKENEA